MEYFAITRVGKKLMEYFAITIGLEKGGCSQKGRGEGGRGLMSTQSQYDGWAPHLFNSLL